MGIDERQLWGTPYRNHPQYLTAEEWSTWGFWGQRRLNDALFHRLRPSVEYSEAQIADMRRIAELMQRECSDNRLMLDRYYRGESYQSTTDVRRRFRRGARIVLDRLTSVSMFPNMAKLFAIGAWGPISVVWTIEVEPRSEGLPGAHMWIGYRSHEAVLPVGAAFRVKSLVRRGTRYHLRLIPDRSVTGQVCRIHGGSPFCPLCRDYARTVNQPHGAADALTSEGL